MESKTAILVTTCDRPKALDHSLGAISALGQPVLVVDDSKRRDSWGPNAESAFDHGCRYLRMPENRGLAAAMNIGLSYWLADTSVRWISYFQDDVEIDPLILHVMEDVWDAKDRPLVTGHHGSEHKTEVEAKVAGVRVLGKRNCRATHLFADRGYWASVMPIPTRFLGCPKRVEGEARGLGSEVDFWITHRAPQSIVARGGVVACVPGLVRTFLWKKEDSTWDNTQRAGEDLPLSRDAIHDWPGRPRTDGNVQEV